MLRNLLLSSSKVLSQRFKVRHVKPSGSKKDKVGRPKLKDGLRPEAADKIKSWPKMLELEKAALFDSRLNLSVLKKITYRNQYFDVFDGYVIEFHLPENLSDKNFENSKSVLKQGAWVEVKAGKEVFTAIVLRHDRDHIAVKSLSGRKDLEEDVFYQLGVSSEDSPYDYLIDFWSDANRIRKSLGWENFLRAHHGAQLPFTTKTKKINFFCESLNHSQKEAIARALDPRHHLLSIQGPPGTGKTMVVIEIIQQASKAGKNVLVLAPSHKAVDNISQRISGLVPNQRPHCQTNFGGGPITINNRIKSHESFDEIELAILQANDEFDGDDKSRELLRKRGTRMKINLQTKILNDANVIYGTIGCALVRNLRKYNFKPDIVIIDEAAQTYECTAWHAALLAPKVIFVGDQNQLSPSLMSTEAASKGLDVGVMTYLEKEFGKKIQTRLNKQYRSNEKIMKWSSQTFYDDELQADETVKDITINNLIQNFKVDLNRAPLVFVDTAGAGYRYNEKFDEGKSFFNLGESDVIFQHVHKLLEAGVRPSDIGVISPYQGQVRKISSVLSNQPEITVSTVDGFQGSEREVICFSLVRSNTTQKIGFLQDLRRMNVSMTRAKRQLFIVGDSKMLASEPSLKKLLEILKEDADYIQLSPQIQKKSLQNRK